MVTWLVSEVLLFQFDEKLRPSLVAMRAVTRVLTTQEPRWQLLSHHFACDEKNEAYIFIGCSHLLEYNLVV